MEEPEYIRPKPRTFEVTAKEQERIDHINTLLKLHDVRATLLFKRKFGPTSKPFILSYYVGTEIKFRQDVPIYREKHFRSLETAMKFCHSLMVI